MSDDIDDTTESLKWAYETIKEKLMFGLPENPSKEMYLKGYKECLDTFHQRENILTEASSRG